PTKLPSFRSFASVVQRAGRARRVRALTFGLEGNAAPPEGPSDSSLHIVSPASTVLQFFAGHGIKRKTRTECLPTFLNDITGQRLSGWLLVCTQRCFPFGQRLSSKLIRLRGLCECWRIKGGLPSQKGDRKSTRLNSSHQIISYAVFCLKKKSKVISTNKLMDES